MLPSCSRLLVVLALQAALAAVPALDGRALNRPLDRASVVEVDATSVETGVLSQQNAAELGGVILKSAHDRMAGPVLTQLGPKANAMTSRQQLARGVGSSLSFSSHLIRLQI